MISTFYLEHLSLYSCVCERQKASYGFVCVLCFYVCVFAFVIVCVFACVCV